MMTKNDIKYIIDYFLKEDPDTIMGIIVKQIDDDCELDLTIEALAKDIEILEESLFCIERSLISDGEEDKTLICKYLVPIDKIRYISDSY